MELRALLCWASLATALEGEITWGCPYSWGSQSCASECRSWSLPIPTLAPLNTSDQ